MAEIKPSNIKPVSWYEDYACLGKKNFIHDERVYKYIEFEKHLDERLEEFIQIHHSKGDDYGSTSDKEYNELFIGDVHDMENREDIIKYLANNHSLERNKFLIKTFRRLVREKIPEQYMKDREFVDLKLDILEKLLPEYLVTVQLYELRNFILGVTTLIGSIYYSFDIYNGDIILGSENLSFSEFKCPEDQTFALIRKNANWRDIERDITIYLERKKGLYLKELEQKFGIKFKAISKILQKVQGAVNYYQGKIFEDFVYKKLKRSGLYKEVRKEAGKGESDILAYSKDDKELYIFSLKNLKIDHDPYWLTIEELRPELERAKLCELDHDNVHLILLVFDNYDNISKQIQIDYNNTQNIDIAKV